MIVKNSAFFKVRKTFKTFFFALDFSYFHLLNCTHCTQDFFKSFTDISLETKNRKVD